MRSTVVLLSGFLALALASCTPAPSPAPDAPDGSDYGVPGALERGRIKTAIVEEKLRTALLPAMRAHDIDMWIVLDRENHPDPLHEEIGGGFAGVRSAYIFFDGGGTEPEKIYLGSHVQPADTVIEQVYDEKVYYGYSAEGITPHLRAAVHDRDPERIGVNTSRTLPEADGLTVAFRDVLVEAIGPTYADRLVSAELLVRDFRNLRTPLETELYRQLTEWTARWETEGLTGPHVIPGQTTALDMAGWFEDMALALGMGSFQTVRVVREGDLLPRHALDIPIEPGDIVAVDAGLFYLQFESDMKRTAYVLAPGETEPPESIRNAWAEAVQTSRLYSSKMIPGAIGHEIYEAIMAEAERDGYVRDTRTDPSVGIIGPEHEIALYGHSLGNDLHDIGARVAPDLPFAYGDRVRFPLVEGEFVAMEFHVGVPIPEWNGKKWSARYEEIAVVGPEGLEGFIPFQTELLLIPSR